MCFSTGRIKCHVAYVEAVSGQSLVRCELVRDLSPHMPDGVILHPLYRFHEALLDGCLCQIDLEATAEWNEYRWFRENRRPGNVYFRRKLH